MKSVIALLLFFFSAKLYAQCTVGVTIQDSIGAATYDILKRATEKANHENCDSIFVRINTPGGHLQSTRLITELILASDKPFLCLISPAGGHAGSAGAIILQACHVSGGLTATNLGAATPILGGGEEMPKDLRNKMINDSVSWLKGMTELRGRNLEFSEKIITEGKAVTSDEAVKMKALDIVAITENEFLEKSKGRSYKDDQKNVQKVIVGELHDMPSDIRYKVLQWISEPEWAYLLFMGALLLLYAEFSHPGLILPGVTGAVLLVLSMIAFHKLEASYGGMVLMLLGLVFWIAELFITSKGILGVAGTVSFILGSFLLFDQETTGFTVPLRLIATATVVFGGMSAALAYFAAQSLKRPKNDYDTQMHSARLQVIETQNDGLSGRLEALGEIWSFQSQDKVTVGDSVVFVERQNLKLIVRKK